MGKVIVEIFSAHTQRREFRSFDRFPVRIGRGFDNDVILPDRYVSGVHLLLEEREGGWTAKDVSDRNGIFHKGKVTQGQTLDLVSGDALKIGRTQLKIYSASHPVLPTQRLPLTHPFFKIIRHPLVALALTALLMALDICDHFLTTYEQTPVEQYLARASMLVLMIVFWAGGWAFVGRLIQHRTLFCAQVSVNALFFLVLYVTSEGLAKHIGYLTSSSFLEGILEAGLMGVLFILLLCGNLSIATDLPRRRQIIASATITLLIEAVFILTYFASLSQFRSEPEYSSSLKPPYIQPWTRTSPEAFLKDSEDIFTGLDQQLKKSQRANRAVRPGPFPL